MICSIGDTGFLSDRLATGIPAESSTTLKTYSVKVLNSAPVGGAAWPTPGESSVRLVSFVSPQEEQATSPETSPSDTSPVAPAAGDATDSVEYA